MQTTNDWAGQIAVGLLGFLGMGLRKEKEGKKGKKKRKEREACHMGAETESELE